MTGRRKKTKVVIFAPKIKPQRLWKVDAHETLPDWNR